MQQHPLEPIMTEDSELFAAIERNREMAFESGELSKKEKLLIAIALDASKGAVEGVKSLSLQAIAEGAGRGEIMEALRVAYFITGAGSIYTASRGIADIFSENG
jgi:alkylhydroperoxidase/carboxymuconolactone decarboxylase family protein YurZ